ncbi:MAG: DUF4215 domain-containing protein, partial [Candidatus Pacebacteria bacterium]|nr:DUF4215 domain-containing protein [Candidatus Paceibacterota bacterium]
MEMLNKKTLLRIFLGFIFIQASVLLAISANFLLAETTITTDPLTIEFTNIPSSPLSGDQTFHAMTNKAVAYVNFKVMDSSGTYTPYPGIFVANSNNEYYFTWPTSSFTDGVYSIRAIASDEINTTDVYIYDVQIQNETYPTSVCGDGTINTGEYCDDGNTISGDGCSYDCQYEAAT